MIKDSRVTPCDSTDHVGRLLVVWGCTKPSDREKPASPPKASLNMRGLMAINPDSAVPPDVWPGLSPVESPHQHQYIGPAMPKDPNTNPMWVYRLPCPEAFSLSLMMGTCGTHSGIKHASVTPQGCAPHT